MLAANTPADVEEPSTLLGQIERVRDNVLAGWACNVARSDEAIQVGVRVGARDIGSGIADIPRTDLRKAGLAVAILISPIRLM